LGTAVFRRLADPLAAYDAPLSRAIAATTAFAGRFRKERAKLERYLAEIAGRPEAVLDISWQRSASLRGLPLVEALLAASAAVRYRDPHLMWSLALLAKGAAEALDPGRYPAALLADCQARAWAELANAERVADNFDAAETALSEAKRLLLGGSGEPLSVARVVDVEASLRTAQRKLPQAVSLLEGLCRTYREIGERHLTGRALISLGQCIYYGGDAAKAAAYLAEALSLFDQERDAQMAATARKNYLLFLADSGQFLRASELLLRSGLREAFQNEPLTLLRLRWVEGKIFAGLARLDRAVQAFEEVHAGFVERSLHYDAALAGLDLAEALLRQDRTARVRQIATETYETLKSLGIQGEALRALDFLNQAAARDRVTLPKVQSVRRFLALAEWQPQLKFAAG
jgi:tetratricopeptide (TPR) repeat protein